MGFRASTRQAARAERLVGWVRNCEDGSVEAHLQGEESAVLAVLDWMRAGGPPGGRVDGLDQRSAAPEADLRAFDVRA